MKALEFAAFVWLVYERSPLDLKVIVFSIHLHLLSEHMRWNYASFNVKSNRLMSTSSQKIIKWPKYFIHGHSSHPHFPHWNNPIFISCTITELSVIAWHLLWLLTTEGKNIVKLLAISQTHQFTVWFNQRLKNIHYF